MYQIRQPKVTRFPDFFTIFLLSIQRFRPTTDFGEFPLAHDSIPQLILEKPQVILDTPIFTESFLSFIGLGVKAPMPSLGSLANAARAGISEYSYKLIFPAMMICLITLACNLLGDGLRDAFDPKLRR